MSILVLQSSWWGRESWSLCLVCLPGVSWWLCGSTWRCNRLVCGLWMVFPESTSFHYVDTVFLASEDTCMHAPHAFVYFACVCGLRWVFNSYFCSESRLLFIFATSVWRCHYVKQILKKVTILVRIPWKSQSYQASIQCWAIIGTPANDGPLREAFGFSLPSSTKENSWTPSGKAFWIRAWVSITWKNTLTYLPWY